MRKKGLVPYVDVCLFFKSKFVKVFLNKQNIDYSNKPNNSYSQQLSSVLCLTIL